DTCASRRPRKEKPGSKIHFAADVGLVLVPQTGSEGQIRPDAPLVLHKKTELGLSHSGFGVSTGNRKLGCTATERSHVCSSLEQECTSIALETGDGDQNGVAIAIVHDFVVCVQEWREPA